MLAVDACSVHMVEAVCSGAPEVMAVVPVQIVRGVAVPEEAVVAPIAVVKGAVIAVILAVVIARTRGDADTDAFASCATGRRDQNQKSPDRIAGASAHFCLLAPGARSNCATDRWPCSSRRAAQHKLQYLPAKVREGLSAARGTRREQR